MEAQRRGAKTRSAAARCGLGVVVMKVVQPGLGCEIGVAKVQFLPELPDERAQERPIDGLEVEVCLLSGSALAEQSRRLRQRPGFCGGRLTSGLLVIAARVPHVLRTAVRRLVTAPIDYRQTGSRILNNCGASGRAGRALPRR